MVIEAITPFYRTLRIKMYRNDARPRLVSRITKRSIHIRFIQVTYNITINCVRILSVITRAVMHRVCGLKIEVCYVDNADFLGCFLFGLPSTRSRHCKKSNFQIAPAHLSEAIAPSQYAPRFKDPSLKRGERCEGPIALLKCAGAI